MKPTLARPLGLGLLLVIPCLSLALQGSKKADDRLRFKADKQGPNGTVILFNNCDASDRTKGPSSFADNKDCVINGPEDLKQLEPIAIEKALTRGPVALKLVNFDATQPDAPVSKVRIFSSKGQAILGSNSHASCDPGLSGSYTLSQVELLELGRGDFTLFAEGLQFSATVRLQMFDAGMLQDEVILHVAPFMLLPHTQPPQKNMVIQIYAKGTPFHPTQQSDKVESARYTQEFKKKCFDLTSGLFPAAQMHVDVLEAAHGDVWIEDELSWGFSETPRGHVPVALHLLRFRELQFEVSRFLAPGVGYVRAVEFAKHTGSSLNSGGNLEITPPTEKYRFGRVYYGSTTSPPSAWPTTHPPMSPGYEAFFKSQKRHPLEAEAVQEPISLCTDWLAVGHVDEIVTFVRANNSRGFVLLYASPALGWELLDTLPLAAKNDPQYMARDIPKGREAPYQIDYGIPTVAYLLDANFRDKPLRRGDFLGPRSLKDYNYEVEAKVRDSVRRLKEGLGLTDDEIKPVPVLFLNAGAVDPVKKIPVPARYWNAGALTPTLVNISAMGTACLIPDPFIPAYRDYMKTMLEGLGLRVDFIDDWILYHLRHGEVHCGSNMQRLPFERKWWK